MSVNEYSLKFIKMYKYASSLNSNARDKMSYMLTAMSEDLKDEFHVSMILDNINLSRIVVHGQKVEDSHLRKKNREANKARSFESCLSKNKLMFSTS